MCPHSAECGAGVLTLEHSIVFSAASPSIASRDEVCLVVFSDETCVRLSLRAVLPHGGST